MRLIAEVRLDPDDEFQGDTVASWLDTMAESVRRKKKFSIFSRKIEGESIWKVVP